MPTPTPTPTIPVEPISVLLTTGTSYETPYGATSVKIWAIGGGGGGAGASGPPPQYGTSGGGGGAGGLCYAYEELFSQKTIVYNIGPGGSGGQNYNDGSDGIATELSITGGITFSPMTANGGKGGKKGGDQPLGGEGGTGTISGAAVNIDTRQGGSGGTTSGGDQGGAGGGAVGGGIASFGGNPTSINYGAGARGGHGGVLTNLQDIFSAIDALAVTPKIPFIRITNNNGAPIVGGGGGADGYGGPGYAATGFGFGGGGGSDYGGNGGNGFLGGGGGGGAGEESGANGGNGGQGCVLLQFFFTPISTPTSTPT